MKQVARDSCEISEEFRSEFRTVQVTEAMIIR